MMLKTCCCVGFPLYLWLSSTGIKPQWMLLLGPLIPLAIFAQQEMTFKLWSGISHPCLNIWRPISVSSEFFGRYKTPKSIQMMNQWCIDLALLLLPIEMLRNIKAQSGTSMPFKSRSEPSNKCQPNYPRDESHDLIKGKLLGCLVGRFPLILFLSMYERSFRL